MEHGSSSVGIRRASMRLEGEEDAFLQVSSMNPPLDSAQACMNHLTLRRRHQALLLPFDGQGFERWLAPGQRCVSPSQKIET